MSELTYFDAYAEYGPRRGKHVLERWTLDHLLEDLDLAGIAGALVRHSQAKVYDAMYANERLVREIAPHRDRLFPCWAVIPPLVGEFPLPRDLVHRMRDGDVRAAVIYPHSHGLDLYEPFLRPLADALAEEQILILVSYRELGSFDAAHRFLEIFAHNPVLLTDHTWAEWRTVQLLMQAHANLHLEFSSFQAMRAVEWFGEVFGHERLLFGTNLPFKAPGAARGYCDWRLMDDASAQAVAGGNLRRLLKGAGPTDPPAPGRWHDALTAEARAGLPLSCHVLNAHCHVLHDGSHWAGGTYIQLEGNAPGMLEVFERMGVDGVALMSWNGTVSMDMEDGNRIVAGQVEHAPDRLIGVVTLDPTHMDAEKMRREMEHYHLELGFPGMKHDIATTLSFSDPRFDPWWEFGDRHHLYVLFDKSPGDTPQIVDVARRHPNLHVLVAHTGRGLDYAQMVVEAARECPNLYAELTYTAVPNGLVEYLCAEIGADRVLFGTDSPMRDPRPQLGWVVFTRLSAEEKRQIVGGNFRRILAAGRLPGCRLPERFLGNVV